MMIEVQHVSKTYPLGDTLVTALKDVSLSIQSGEFLAIAGPSGSGKSTLLNLIGCLEQPTEGRVVIDGAEIGAMSSDEQAEWRTRKLGFVFQTFNLLPVFTAFENVEYPLYLQKRPEAERSRVARQLLEDVGLAAQAHHRPAQLSGGQRQRVAIARALAASPVLVLADEPTANLDVVTGLEILDLMKQLNQRRGVTFLFSTHDPKILARAGRVIPLAAGRVVTS